MPEIVKFEMPRVETVVQGVGAVREIGAELDRRDLKRVFLVTGHSVGSSEAFAALASDLGDRVVGIFDQVKAHNPVELIVELITAAKSAQAEAFVAVGGGSPVDAAKLAAIGLCEGSESVEDLARNYLVFEYPNTIHQKPADRDTHAGLCRADDAVGSGMGRLRRLGRPRPATPRT